MQSDVQVQEFAIKERAIMLLDQKEIEMFRELEESLWRDETRNNTEYLERVFAEDFFEFGQSGRRYNREDMFIFPQGDQAINCKLPLKNFAVRSITEEVVLVTYISEVIYDDLQIANRSSIWLKTPQGWRLKFHQGTPTENKSKG